MFYNRDDNSSVSVAFCIYVFLLRRLFKCISVGRKGFRHIPEGKIGNPIAIEARVTVDKALSIEESHFNCIS